MPPDQSSRNFDVSRLREQHRLMWRIRALEQAALRGLAEKVVLGAIHPSIGQEAVAAGVVGNLRRDDILQCQARDLAVAEPAVPRKPFGQFTAHHAGGAENKNVQDPNSSVFLILSILRRVGLQYHSFTAPVIAET